VENFGSGMVRFGSIRISGLLSGEHISEFGSDMGPGRSVRISGLGSVLPSLLSRWSLGRIHKAQVAEKK